MLRRIRTVLAQKLARLVAQFALLRLNSSFTIYGEGVGVRR